MSLDVLRRLRGDYEYWARTCYRILDKHGNIVPLKLRPHQQAIGEAEARELARTGKARLFVLKGRQGGITTDQQARSLWTCWRTPHAKCMTLAHEGESTAKIFEITTRALDQWPRRELLPALGPKAAKEISFPGLGSSFYTGTAGAKRTGRGLTLTRLHGSEFAFWDDPMTLLSAAEPALERPGTTIVLETTASGYGSKPHEFWKRAADGGSSYVPLFYPWWMCDPELYRTPLEEPDELGALDEEEALLVTHHGLDAEQLKWRRQKIRDKGRELFLQEYAEDPESCWLAPGGLFYDVAQLKRLMTSAAKPVRSDLNGALQWFVTEEELRAILATERVILGADTAEGVDGDRSTFVARAFPSGRKLAQYADEKVDPIAFAGILDTYGKRLNGAGVPAFLIVEKNLHGITTLRQLRDVHRYPASRIYHRAVQDKRNAEKGERIGWHTSAETQPLLLDAGRELFNAMEEGLASVCSADVLRDAFAVRRDDTGRVKLTGRDLLVAECLAWIARRAMPTVERLPATHFAT